MSFSIVIASRNRARQLDMALSSIEEQYVRGSLDIVLIDDGSVDETPQVIIKHGPLTRGFRINRTGGYRWNPGSVLNAAHKMTSANVVIEQGGEVCHLTDCVGPLVKTCRPGLVSLARVYNGPEEQMKRLKASLSLGNYHLPEDIIPDTVVTEAGHWPAAIVEGGLQLFCGLERQAPFLFLGAIHREDWNAVGGYDESLRDRNDTDLANRLTARGIKFAFLGKAVAWHLAHSKT